MNEKQGSLHPLSALSADLYSIFTKLGFSIASGPELETEYYNFDALNIPKDHPARDMQDTFWLKQSKEDLRLFEKPPNDLNAKSGRLLLRTHTSPVQIRYMKNHKPPIRMMTIGRVFRNEATDATHEVEFLQLEALAIDKDISLAHLKGMVSHFFKELFGSETKTRFRPSFFPFTEPSLEVDTSCFFCKGKGCKTCKGEGFIEMGGAGMVHPNVLIAGGISSREYQGFAFGFGLDRLLMIRHGIPDVRLLYSGDLRFVNQF